jgi:hypothetical protein
MVIIVYILYRTSYIAMLYVFVMVEFLDFLVHTPHMRGL